MSTYSYAECAICTLRSRVAVPLLLILTAAGYALAAAACSASFVGPATSNVDETLITCGTEKCNPNYYACSTMKPYHCEYVGNTFPVGAAHDAGSDR